MQLGQAEPVRAVHQDRVGGRHVDPGFDDRRAQQQVEALLIEIPHHMLQLALGHLPVGDPDARFRYQFGEQPVALLDRFDRVVQEVDLSAALELAQAGPRESGRRFSGHTKVLIASRRCGAVAITEKSRIPSSDIASVRGIGVAVKVSTSTSGAQRLEPLFLAHNRSDAPRR